VLQCVEQDLQVLDKVIGDVFIQEVLEEFHQCVAVCCSVLQCEDLQVLDKVIGHVFIQEVLEEFHQTKRDLKLIHAVFVEILEKRRHEFEFFLFDQNGNNDV